MSLTSPSSRAIAHAHSIIHSRHPLSSLQPASLLSFLSLSPLFLQEPQTTVIHNPVDGTKVHPPSPISLSLHPLTPGPFFFHFVTRRLHLVSLSVWGKPYFYLENPVGCVYFVEWVFLCAPICVFMHETGRQIGRSRSCDSFEVLFVVLYCPSVLSQMELSLPAAGRARLSTR